jgi:hypothetical protein
MEQRVETKLASLGMEPGDDPITLRAGDSRGRKIFLAYTVRIPWLSGRDKLFSREDESSYLRAITSAA